MQPGSPMPPNGGGMPPSMPPGRGAPPPAGGAPRPGGGGSVDPNNKLQQLLLSRVQKLGPQDQEALMALSPPQANALKKVLPELGFLIDRMILQGGGGGGQGEGGAPAAPMPPPPRQSMQPGGRLNSVMA